MQEDKTGFGNFNHLRRRAETIIHRQSPNYGPNIPANPDKLSPAASQNLLHDLHLYQIELETQSEELRRTQEALESTRARYFDLLEYTSTLYNQAPIGYFTLTDDGTILEANLTAADLLEVKRGALIQQSITHFIVAEDQAIFHFYGKQLLATKQPQRYELRMIRADGSLFFVQMNVTITGDTPETEHTKDSLDSKQTIRLTISDISARVQLEEEERKLRDQLETTLFDLREAQSNIVKQERQAVVGQLAAGIAHDFNNILAAITLYAQLVMRASDLPARLRERMEVIVAQSGRAADLVQQVLDFSRQTVISRQPSALIHLLQEVATTWQKTQPESVQVSLDTGSLQSGVDDVANFDLTRIQQALHNLVRNAYDAMPEGGELRITLSRHLIGDGVDSEGTGSESLASESLDSSNVAGDSPALGSGRLTPGSWLRIAISDTGTGIQPQELPYVFEPFFTTKSVGKGSGLGLAQVWGIIKQHDGEIDVISQVGKGTSFLLYLPAQPLVSPTYPASDTEATPQGHDEMVLVVEDNDVLRTALTASLERLGYQVLEAGNGQDAAMILAKEGDKVQLILSDQKVRDMDSEALIHTLRSHGGHQPVVFLSGQPLPESEVERLSMQGQISWLLKPPTLSQLALTLNQALDSHPAKNA
jgi:two-component system, cell cycle sensor histidine kinase and response regulator CckA